MSFGWPYTRLNLENFEDCQSVTSVSQEFGIIFSAWSAFQTMGKAIRTFSSGLPRVATIAEYRCIILQTKRSRRWTAEEITMQVEQTTERQLYFPCLENYSKMVYIHKNEYGVYYSYLVIKDGGFCGDRKEIQHEEARIIFTNKSLLSMVNDSWPIHIWKKQPSNSLERGQFVTPELFFR